jgi:hypothetical protein
MQVNVHQCFHPRRLVALLDHQTQRASGSGSCCKADLLIDEEPESGRVATDLSARLLEVLRRAVAPSTRTPEPRPAITCGR